jgi:hypothetical protein
VTTIVRPRRQRFAGEAGAAPDLTHFNGHDPLMPQLRLVSAESVRDRTTAWPDCASNGF